VKFLKILVTGGAGYIGSQVALDLSRRGHEPVILDNLSKGHQQAVITGRFINGNIGDAEFVKRVVSGEKIQAVIHLAADSQVGESVRDPGKYYRNNIVNGLALLDAIRESGVKYFVFSSTAAVYGEPETTPITEDHPKHPSNPYGFSKLTFEGILNSYDAAYGLRYISLRYFNAAGADPKANLGEDHNPETHLIPIVFQTVLGSRPHLELFGTDYPTPDGTCIRDYIHVADLSEAHLLALEALAGGSKSSIYNLGNGQGYSNRQVIEAAQQLVGKKIPVVESARRPGDPAVLVASSERIQAELGWKPKYPGLREIMETAWRWHRHNPEGYGRRR
jgi:UDP-glucose 4-epimerase